MLAIPATIAGCREIVLCTPPNQSGQLAPAIRYAAYKWALPAYFKSGDPSHGGMTFGTETIPQVYKILGPGNQYVTAAKQKATQYGVSIDMPADRVSCWSSLTRQQSRLMSQQIYYHRQSTELTARWFWSVQVKTSLIRCKTNCKSSWAHFLEKRLLHKHLQTQRPFTLLLNPMPLILSTNMALSTISFVWPTKTSLSRGGQRWIGVYWKLYS